MRPKSSLHHIGSLTSRAQPIVGAHIAQAVAGHLACKWHAHAPQSVMNVLDICMRFEAMPLRISESELEVAFARIRRRDRIGPEGTCVLAWAQVAETMPQIVCSAVESWLVSTPTASSTELRAVALGKSGSAPMVEQVRMLVPLPLVWQVADAVLTARINGFLDTHVPSPECCWLGALPGTQPLDIVHGCSLVVEKGLDLRGAGCAAQLDIKAYYDSVSALRCAQWLGDRGAEPALCAAVLRHQLLPRIKDEVGGGEACLPRRGSGTLTGSRTAGALGRIPVLDVFVARHAHWQQYGFRLADGRGRPSAILCDAAYVDNMYVVGPTPGCAIAILEDFARVAREPWGLRIKDGSRAAVSSCGLEALRVTPRSAGRRA